MNTLKLLRKAVTISALPLLVSLSFTQVGCLGHSGPSAVAQGQKFESGDPTYDQFFDAVHDLSVEMAQAPKTEKDIRMSLGKKLDVEPDEDDDATPAPAAATPSSATASTDAANAQPSVTDAYGEQLKKSAINAIPGGSTVNALNQQYQSAKNTVNQFKSMFGGGGAAQPAAAAAPQPAAPVVKEPKAPSAALLAKAVKKHAEKYNVQLKLDVDETANDGDGKTSMRIGGDSSDGKTLADQVEGAAKDELSLIVKMGKAKKKLEKLSALAVALEANADATFRKSRGTASDVKKNLADSKALIKLMDERAAGVTSRARQLLSKLEDAANADLPAVNDAPAQNAVAQTDEAKKEEPTAEAKVEEKSEKSQKAEKAEKKAEKTEKAEKSAKATPKKARPSAKAAAPGKRPQTAMVDFEP